MQPNRVWKHPIIDYKRFVLFRFFDADFCNSCFFPASNLGTSELEARPQARLCFLQRAAEI
jgi:hypothetical protein